MKQTFIVGCCALFFLFCTQKSFAGEPSFLLDGAQFDDLQARYENVDQLPGDEAGWKTWRQNYNNDLSALEKQVRADMLCSLKDSGSALAARIPETEGALSQLGGELEEEARKRGEDAALAGTMLRLKIRLYLSVLEALPPHPGCGVN